MLHLIYLCYILICSPASFPANSLMNLKFLSNGYLTSILFSFRDFINIIVCNLNAKTTKRGKWSIEKNRWSVEISWRNNDVTLYDVVRTNCANLAGVAQKKKRVREIRAACRVPWCCPKFHPAATARVCPADFLGPARSHRGAETRTLLGWSYLAHPISWHTCEKRRVACAARTDLGMCSYSQK